MKSISDTFELENGVKIPCLGFGTWQAQNGEIAVNAVKEALKIGYRLIDTAAIYENETSVGKGIELSGVPRNEIFVTSKVWNSAQGYESTKKAFHKSLSDLGLDYLDLYLIHWPIPGGRKEEYRELNKQTWRAMEELYEDGKIRAIGVSNFLPHHLEPLMEHANIKPMVNQIEFHPGYIQTEAVEFCKKHDIQVEAWSPLARGKLFEKPELKELSEKYGKTIAQICLRWELQQDIIPLPKSVTPSRIAENADVFDFEISVEDMKRIDKLKDCGWSGLHPDSTDF